jgi:DNA-binding transcriptional regulator YdaS (Cro superfamily)
MLNTIQTKELAEFLGVSDGFISQIKTGYRKLPPKYCQRVSKRFNIPLSDLRPDIFGDKGVDSVA